MPHSALLAAIHGTLDSSVPAAAVPTVPISVFSDDAVARSSHVVWWDEAEIERSGSRRGFGRKLKGGGLGNDPDSLIPAAVFAGSQDCYWKEFATANAPGVIAELLLHFETAAERAADSNGTNNLSDHWEANGAVLVQAETGERTGMKFSFDLDSAEPYNMSSTEIASMVAAYPALNMHAAFHQWLPNDSDRKKIKMAMVDLSAGHPIDLTAFTAAVPMLYGDVWDSRRALPVGAANGFTIGKRVRSSYNNYGYADWSFVGQFGSWNGKGERPVITLDVGGSDFGFEIRCALSDLFNKRSFSFGCQSPVTSALETAFQNMLRDNHFFILDDDGTVKAKFKGFVATEAESVNAWKDTGGGTEVAVITSAEADAFFVEANNGKGFDIVIHSESELP